MAKQPDPRHANRLLASLPAADFADLAPHMRVGDFRRGDIIAAAGDQVEQVWFPLDAVVSLTSAFRDGGTAETATVGCGAWWRFVAALGNKRTLSNQVVQVAGRTAGIDGARFHAAFEERPVVRRLRLRYSEVLFDQVFQSVARNVLHLAEARLPRWLLMVRVRHGGGSTLHLTHDFLAEMLGMHRPTVTLGGAGVADGPAWSATGAA